MAVATDLGLHGYLRADGGTDLTKKCRKFANIVMKWDPPPPTPIVPPNTQVRPPLTHPPVARQHLPGEDTHLPSGFSALNLVLIAN